VTAPLVIGDSSTLANVGTVTGAGTLTSVQFGNNAQITNTGTITATGTAAAIVVGTNSTVTNSGTLTAVAGYNAVQFGAGGTFVNTASAPAAVTGNIAFGVNTGTSFAHFTNDNTAFGFTGNVTAQGNVIIDNAGLWTGSLTESYENGTVGFTNEAAGTFTGILSSEDQGTFVNNGTMTLTNASAIGSNAGVTTGSTFTNNGTLSLGSTTATSTLTIKGSYTQGSSGVLNAFILPSGTTTINGSQILATGANGTASLAGTLNLSIAAGFYASGSIYQAVVADQGITGAFSTITGNKLAFITFVPLGVVTTSGTQQAYEFQVERTTTYHDALVAGGVTNAAELAIAKAFQPVATYADANTSSDAATLVGDLDVLTVAQAQTFFDNISPAGYYAYSVALRDQANMFSRQVALRMNDQNSEHDEDGWWLTGNGQFDMSSPGGQASKEKIYAVTGGYDFSGPHHVLGLAGTVSWSNLDYAPGTLTGTNHLYGIDAYGGIELGPIHLNGQLAADFGHLGANKTMVIGSVTRSADASASEILFKATGTAGFDVNAGDLLLTPFVGIDFMKGHISGFTETNAGAADLTVSEISADRTDLLAGASLAKNTGSFRPYIKAVYRSAIGNAGDNSVTAYLNGDSSTSFTVAAVGASRHEIDADAGINFVFDDAGSLFVGYQGTMRSSYSAHGINAGIRLEF
jgi:uncharacterized protein YhjY with autotransporter beta-barrel domain